MVDTQGGCCDNDIHEHFKCLEETVLGKIFVNVYDDKISVYGGKATVKNCSKQYLTDPWVCFIRKDGINKASTEKGAVSNVNLRQPLFEGQAHQRLPILTVKIQGKPLSSICKHRTDTI